MENKSRHQTGISVNCMIILEQRFIKYVARPQCLVQNLPTSCSTVHLFISRVVFLHIDGVIWIDDQWYFKFEVTMIYQFTNWHSFDISSILFHMKGVYTCFIIRCSWPLHNYLWRGGYIWHSIRCDTACVLMCFIPRGLVHVWLVYLQFRSKC